MSFPNAGISTPSKWGAIWATISGYLMVTGRFCCRTDFQYMQVEQPLKSDFVTNDWQEATYESGLDNSPINDKVPFSKQTHLLELVDAGLRGLKF